MQSIVETFLALKIWMNINKHTLELRLILWLGMCKGETFGPKRKKQSKFTHVNTKTNSRVKSVLLHKNMDK